jgi:hypothetical protein
MREWDRRIDAGQSFDEHLHRHGTVMLDGCNEVRIRRLPHDVTSAHRGCQQYSRRRCQRDRRGADECEENANSPIHWTPPLPPMDDRRSFAKRFPDARALAARCSLRAGENPEPVSRSSNRPCMPGTCSICNRAMERMHFVEPNKTPRQQPCCEEMPAESMISDFVVAPVPVDKEMDTLFDSR